MLKALKISDFDGSNFTTHELILGSIIRPHLYHGAQTSTQYMNYELCVF